MSLLILERLLMGLNELDKPHSYLRMICGLIVPWPQRPLKPLGQKKEEEKN